MKTDFNGNIIWSKGYHTYGGNDLYETTPKIHKTHDNCYAFINGTCWVVSGMVKIDSSGNVVFSQDLFIDAYDLSVTKDSGFIIIGNGPMCSLKTPYQNYEIGILKTDSLGNGSQCISEHTNYVSQVNTIISSPVVFTSSLTGALSSIHPAIDSIELFYYQGCVDFTSGIKENDFSSTILIFPVPTKNIITIEDPNLTKNETISIYNIQGQLLLQQIIHQNKTDINISDFDKGVYILRVIDNDKNVVKKIIKE